MSRFAHPGVGRLTTIARSWRRSWATSPAIRLVLGLLLVVCSFATEASMQNDPRVGTTEQTDRSSNPRRSKDRPCSGGSCRYRSTLIHHVRRRRHGTE
jgi:hypothetical protein